MASNNFTAGGGGGISSSGLITVKNTTLARNRSLSVSAFSDVAGTFVSSGHNLIGLTNGFPTFTAPGGQAGDVSTPIAPLLGPLQDNGGRTPTHALLTGSPAIDAGDKSGAPATDQRGLPRPGGVTTTVDLGAYESSFAPLPLTIECGLAFETNTMGCATTRALLIPAELARPAYSGGSGPPTLKVKFEGEALDYTVPPSLTFPVGVTNLVWSYTAGLETVSCTQQVTMVRGVNASPGIVLTPPAPATLATNAATGVTLVVSDAETANPATLSVSSSSGGLVTLLSSGPDGSGNYSLTITAGSVPGTETITNIVTDGCGATETNTFTLVVVGPVSLSISMPTPAEVQISWPMVAGALVLQYTDSLVPPIIWQPDSHPIITNGLLKAVTIDLPTGTRFYSLGIP